MPEQRPSPHVRVAPRAGSLLFTATDNGAILVHKI